MAWKQQESNITDMWGNKDKHKHHKKLNMEHSQLILKHILKCVRGTFDRLQSHTGWSCQSCSGPSCPVLIEKRNLKHKLVCRHQIISVFLYLYLTIWYVMLKGSCFNFYHGDKTQFSTKLTNGDRRLQKSHCWPVVSAIATCSITLRNQRDISHK